VPLRTDHVPAEPRDHFVERDGVRFAGAHLIVDMWGARGLDDLGFIEQVLHEAADSAGATTLEHRMHHFPPHNGVTGVMILAESHISIHTWPERGFAAVDIFMCGDSRPHAAVAVLKRRFAPAEITVDELRRGLRPQAAR
jgi:S-adenosylmethionine decarboxylase